MIAASNATRLRLNALARARLDADGVLHGPALVVGDREFRAGDWVIARHNDRRLRSSDSSWWVRNGSSGQIVAVDPASGEVQVDFTDRVNGRLQRIKLPGMYVTEHLDHGYAVTDYGVQGRTLSRSRTVLDEASTLPGAYVASTRGRHENRLYASDGDLVNTDGLESSHGAPIVRAPSLAELAARVATRRPDGMLHDRDPNLEAAAALAAAWSVDDLKDLLQHLDEAVPAVPGDPSVSLRNAEAALARLQERGVRPQADTEAAAVRLHAAVLRLRNQAERYQRAVASQVRWRHRRTLFTDALALRETKERLGASASVDPNVQTSREP